MCSIPKLINSFTECTTNRFATGMINKENFNKSTFVIICSNATLGLNVPLHIELKVTNINNIQQNTLNDSNLEATSMYIIKL